MASCTACAKCAATVQCAHKLPFCSAVCSSRYHGEDHIEDDDVSSSSDEEEQVKTDMIGATRDHGGSHSSSSSKDGHGGQKKWIQHAVKEKNKGKFGRWAKRHGYSSVTEAAIQAGEHSKNPHVRHEAQFAENVRHLHHHH